MEWNCYARNYFLGVVIANKGESAIELAASNELWRKYSLVKSEISVIQSKKDVNKHKINIESCRDYRIKYPS